MIINGVATLAQKLGLDDTDSYLQYFYKMEKHWNEKLPWLVGSWVIARAEDIEDVNKVQTVLSLPLDSPVLLMTEEEYEGTL